MYRSFIATKADPSKAWINNYNGFDCGATNCGKVKGTATGDWAKVEQWLADDL